MIRWKSTRRLQHLAWLMGFACAPMAGAAAPLFNPADKALAPRFILSDATAAVVSASDGPALRVSFGVKSSYPSIRFEAAAIGFPADWSGHGELALTVGNPGSEPVPLGLRVDSRAADKAGRQDTAEIPPGRTARLVLPVGKGASIVGMIGQPPPAGLLPGDVRLEPSATPFDPAAVLRFQLFVGKPKQKHAILLKRVELLDGIGPKLPFVDRFGQFNGADWPGKLHDAGEFSARRDAERAALGKSGRLAGYDEFGGWAGGPKLEATGRFRVQKHEGKWWFVDPAGRLFWSSGITGVRFNNATRVGGRENFFDWLPPAGDPLARFFAGKGKGRSFDFYAANLFRKYGEHLEDAFFDVSTRRLLHWGVNTIANWSDERAWALKRVPYVVPVHAGGPHHFVVTERLKAGQPWIKRFPDPFDPRFAAALDEKLAAFASLKDDPWLLGVFIDNELPWAEGAPGGIRRVSAAALDLPGTAPVKAGLLDRLRAGHESIGALNKAFGTGFASWEEAAAPWKLSPAQCKAADTALAPLDAAIAEKYFQTCRDSLRRRLPGALYLGCRFHVYNREAIRAAAKCCDVVSFNIYAFSPSERQADEFAAELDCPAVIGEFHFGATDRGLFHPGLRRADNQADRAAKYAAYLAEAAAAPWCVGAHWFQYLDQPLTGRGDGENYNIGFVNVADDPHPELAEAARRFHAAMYPLRAGGER